MWFFDSVYLVLGFFMLGGRFCIFCFRFFRERIGVVWFIFLLLVSGLVVFGWGFMFGFISYGCGVEGFGCYRIFFLGVVIRDVF